MIPEQLIRRQISYDERRMAWLITYDYQCRACNIWKAAQVWIENSPTREQLRYYDEAAIPEVIRIANKDCICYPDINDDIPRTFLLCRG